MEHAIPIKRIKNVPKKIIIAIRVGSVAVLSGCSSVVGRAAIPPISITITKPILLILVGIIVVSICFSW
ncbi:uncharacterized protein B0H64DRAFT_395208 [Chaetomium fimeti]|uniref:Uncharacterized protein n=1 Tax=Chaetomium fimeti TaxID=1854472 RepID=A0AAE0LRR0_9PEZI|nr:hypothetical protein B0H64DRAFT_395208 [Chaetomium fimeti]